MSSQGFTAIPTRYYESTISLKKYAVNLKSSGQTAMLVLQQ